MAWLSATFSHAATPADLGAAVKATLGKPLRRASAFTQLAAIGAYACLPENARHEPTALLWQTTSGPRPETLTLLDEMCHGGGEPMPYDFLATQPAITAAQLQPLLPGLHAALHLPLDSEGGADWQLLLTLAITWLQQGRYARVLCAQLDHWPESASGHWLALTAQPLENPLARLQLSASTAAATPDVPTLPQALADWLVAGQTAPLALQSPGRLGQTVEFAPIQLCTGSNHV